MNMRWMVVVVFVLLWTQSAGAQVTYQQCDAGTGGDMAGTCATFVSNWNSTEPSFAIQAQDDNPLTNVDAGFPSAGVYGYSGNNVGVIGVSVEGIAGVEGMFTTEGAGAGVLGSTVGSKSGVEGQALPVIPSGDNKCDPLSSQT
jgi:hypothetical protein